MTTLLPSARRRAFLFTSLDETPMDLHSFVVYITALLPLYLVTSDTTRRSPVPWTSSPLRRGTCT